jgi:radical SAM protein with 4Fe4S-binding SPASM domain
MSGKANQMLRLLFWESTIKCNLTCAHCRRLEDDQAAYKDMSTEEAKGLIRQLAAIGEKQPFNPVMVFSGGEPLCRDDIFELIEYAGSLGIMLALATNGTLVDEETAAKIKASGIARCSVSLDGATSEMHNKLRKLEGSFEQAIGGIGNLRKAGVPFQINMTLTKHNAGQLEQLYDLAKDLGAEAVHIFMLVPVGCGQELADTDMLSSEEYEQKLVEICKLDSRSEIQVKVTCGPHYERVIRQEGLHQERKASGHPGGKVPGRTGHGGPSKGCLAGLGVIFVSHEGDVFPCGYLPVKCGNVLETQLSEIWYNSGELARMRDPGQLEGKCGVCGYREICGGCRARAFSFTENFMAEEPFCAYVPPQATE